ncbi:MAG: hypothetical protein LBB58_04730 [Cellulomonadaceae bacterium]|nr:hypothetical protein [Cellulomonadaceae bacterium]
MAATPRGNRYNALVGEELTVEFAAKGKSAMWVAARIGIARQQLSLYTTGMRPIPVAIVVDACEAVGSVPEVIAVRAYERLCEEMGDSQ